MNWPATLRRWLEPPHPTWRSHASRSRIRVFLCEEERRSARGVRVNLGSASQRFGVNMLNLDLIAGPEVDIQGDLLLLPLADMSVDTVLCTGVLEHVCDPHQAVAEIHRVLRPGGRVFIETPFMQTVHASPYDYQRWTPAGLRELMRNFEILECRVIAGPATALAWQLQETISMLVSFGSTNVYKIGLRVFGYLAVPVSWLDVVLERHPMAWRGASAYTLVCRKTHLEYEQEKYDT